MFEGSFDVIDKIIEFFGKLWESNVLIISAVISAVLLAITLIVVLVLVVVGNPFAKEEITATPEQQAIIDNAPSFCSEKGFNAWKWINETELVFTCYNKETKNESLEKYYKT